MSAVATLAARPLHRYTERESPLSAVKTMLEIIVIAFFITTFIVQPFRIPTASMEPTLRVGDFLLVDKQSFEATSPAQATLQRMLPLATLQRGNLVVFHFPVDPSLLLVKRIIGLPGDRLRLRAGHVWINGKPLAEPYAYYAPARPNIFRDEFPSLREADPNVQPQWWVFLRRAARAGGASEITVPPDQYFVLGDNRNNSEDSRYWGFVPRAAIVGRPLLVYFALRPTLIAPGALTPWQRVCSTLRFGLHSARVLR